MLDAVDPRTVVTAAPGTRWRTLIGALRRGRHDGALLAATAILLGCWRLSLNGLGNLYYTAAAVTGSHSLRAAFFAAFDRSGIMAIDKPPLGVLAPALAVRLLGVSTLAVLGPQVLMFGTGVWLTHRLVAEHAGRRAAAIAALVLMITPIDVAVARSNNPDELLVLLTILGLFLVGRTLSRDHLRWAVGAGVVVGLAFTTKQLQAIVGVPALVVGLLVWSRGPWHRKVLRALIFCAITAISCTAWIAAVDHVGPTHRPYVANSADDTEMTLAFGFNGTHRIDELHTTRPKALRPPVHVGLVTGLARRVRSARNLFTPLYLTQGTWLFAAALAGGSLLLLDRRSGRRRFTALLLLWTAQHAAVLMLVPGKFSPYYVAPLVPGIACLTAMALDRGLSAAAGRHLSAPGIGLLAVLAGGASIAAWRAGVHEHWSRIVAFICALIIIAALAARAAMILLPGGAVRASRPARSAGIVAAVATCCVIGLPQARWTVAAVTHAQDAVNPGAMLDGSPSPTPEIATIQRNDGNLLSYALRHSSPRQLTIATTRIPVSATATVLDGRPVVPLGGFFGTDPFPSLERFTSWIRSGALRWVALPQLPPGRPPSRLPPGIVAKPWGPYVRRSCAQVDPRTFGGSDPRAYWSIYDVEPLHAPLALYDCAQVSPAAQRTSAPTGTGSSSVTGDATTASTAARSTSHCGALSFRARARLRSCT